MFKLPVFVMCLVPLSVMIFDGWRGDLGANPIEELTHRTGGWTLRLLLITLAITPMWEITRRHELMGVRRMLGLFAFFYAVLHFAIYVWFDQFFDWEEIFNDIAKRPFITVGLLGFIILIPLAMTSTRGMQRRLKHYWFIIHRGIYVAAILGVLHFWWLVKADVQEPAVYAVILSVLLGYRLVRIKQKHFPLKSTSASSQKSSYQ